MDNSKKTYKSDKVFLEKYLKLFELSNGESRLLVSPTLQGRVLTSSAQGENGFSFGWINYDLIASGNCLPHCNNFGGEDRYWIGPEGGQFSIFFKKGQEFGLDNWQTPAPIDMDSWNLVTHSPHKALLTKNMELENYLGITLKLLADREVILLDNHEIFAQLNVSISEMVSSVGFKSVNRLTNTSNFAWDEKTGMLSIWILGQFIPSAVNTIMIPFREDSDGIIVNDSYFGKVDANRIKILPGMILFKGDGQKRGKIGIGPSRVLPVIGSIDRLNHTLTVVKFSFNPTNQEYVNSMWKMQDDPLCGDVVNSYNDGPLPDGSIMGPFYELETSSSATRLQPQETLVHEHATFHFTGDLLHLEKLAEKIFGQGITQAWQ